jgi:hypothetical protein
MSTPAFIVDGFTEKLIIGKICPGKPIRRTDLNGKHVTVKAIANKISSLIRLLNNKYYPIIIVIDREDREKNCEEIIEELRLELTEKGHENDDIRINVADKMLENWIIADWTVITESEDKPETTDGLRGSSVIKKHKGSYGKTTDGVELFIKANPSVIYKNSPSFKTFIDSLEGVTCEYKEFEK